jgi:hypothetical protein
MPFRPIATELRDQETVMKARMMEIVDDYMTVLEAIQIAVRQDRISDVVFHIDRIEGAIEMLGGVKVLISVQKMLAAKARAVAEENPELRSVLV